MRVTVAVGVWLLALTALASPALSAGRAPNRVPPNAYYLSLGDSMAFGLQFDRFFEMLDAGTYTPDAFNTGYTDVLASRMQALHPGQQTVNLSCPGESAVTMIEGGCFFTQPPPDGAGLSLHTNYTGPQLEAAVAFLEAHPGQVGPITIAIGGVDTIDTIADSCGFDPACVARSGLREGLGGALDRILGDLRAAAPDAELIVVSLYNPFSVDVPGSNGLWRAYNSDVQRSAARRHDARFVDVFKVAHGRRMCQLTFLCESGDLHPTDDGYRAIADQIFDAAGYGDA